MQKLWDNFFSFFTVSGSVRAKPQVQDMYKTITHIDYLKDLFLGECFTLC